MSKVIKLNIYAYKTIKFVFIIIYYLFSKHLPYLFNKYFVFLPFKYFIFLYWIVLSKEDIKNKKIIKSNNKKPRVTFGFSTLINHKYFSQSLMNNDYKVQVITRVKGNIIDNAEYAVSYDEILERYYRMIPYFIKKKIQDILVFDYVLKTTDLLVIDYYGFGSSDLKNESYWYKKFGIITVIFPFGSDYWMYSKIIDLCYKHGLMINYPTLGKFEKEVRKRVEYWTEHADCIVNGGMIDGASRWDALPCNVLCIDTELWKPNYNRLKNNDTIVIAHAPNHRYVKGTEFIIKAIENLKENGYKVELLLLEKIKNEQLMEILKNNVDIFIEKLNYCIYGLAAIEAMALGIPVISSIHHSQISPLLRRFSYLNECPIIDANQENIFQVIKYLADNEQFRYQIGIASRNFVEKYHSFKSFANFFDLIMQKYWLENYSIDLINCYHPLNPNRLFSQEEIICHPLINNCVPDLINDDNSAFTL